MNNKDYANTFTTLKRADVQKTYLNNQPETTLTAGVVTIDLLPNFLSGNYNNIAQLMPAGITSIPNINDTACMLNLGAGQANPYIIGYNRTQLLSIIDILQPGESSLHSNYYAVNAQNEALKVNYSKINPQQCQLPIGEGYVVVSLDFIAQFEALVSAHNALVTAFNSHMHGGVSSGMDISGGPTVSGSSITIDPNITTDKNWFNAGKALISETGINVPH